jgi:lipopolysaccharide/colanic/teichoic acid biosynthesis glycosyltransferase
MAGAGVVMAIVNRSSPLCKQERNGLNRKPFTMFKIKSMRDAFDAAGKPLPDDQRTSKIGEWLRKSKIDEMPQFFNVLAGDMSIVGPRPALPHLKKAKDEKRHTALPGITGYAQILGENSRTEDEVIALDHEYIDNQSFMGDMIIIMKTPLSLLRNRHAPHYNVAGQITNAHSSENVPADITQG